jgi:hypothetical protein
MTYALIAALLGNTAQNNKQRLLSAPEFTPLDLCTSANDGTILLHEGEAILAWEANILLMRVIYLFRWAI